MLCFGAFFPVPPNTFKFSCLFKHVVSCCIHIWSNDQSLKSSLIVPCCSSPLSMIKASAGDKKAWEQLPRRMSYREAQAESNKDFQYINLTVKRHAKSEVWLVHRRRGFPPFFFSPWPHQSAYSFWKTQCKPFSAWRIPISHKKHPLPSPTQKNQDKIDTTQELAQVVCLFTWLEEEAAKVSQFKGVHMFVEILTGLFTGPCHCLPSRPLCQMVSLLSPVFTPPDWIRPRPNGVKGFKT